MSSGDLLHVVTADDIGAGRRRAGAWLIWGSFAAMVAAFAWCALAAGGWVDGPGNWRPALYGYCLWATCLCIAQVVRDGEQGKRVLFILPATLFVVAMVIFPLIFALSLSFSNWNLSAFEGPRFNGLDNVRQMWADPFYWNALRNTVWYVLAILVEYVIAFGLALILSGQIRARKFFPRCLSVAPDAVAGCSKLDGWQVDAGKPVWARLRGYCARSLGWITACRSFPIPGNRAG